MTRGNLLLQFFLGVLAAQGLAAEALDPWRGWVAFKEFARRAAEEPDAGISVQFTRTLRPAADGHAATLVFLRQAVEREADWLSPVGGVVAEFRFAGAALSAAAAEVHAVGEPRPWRIPPPPDIAGRKHWDLWSYDFPTFERFVDAVEQQPEFQVLVVQRPLRSYVYWEEA